MTFAQRLQYAMDAEGLTQVALAEKSGVSQAAIQKITSGKSQTTKKLLEISRALNVRPEWLGKGEEPMRYGGKGHDSASTIPPEHEWAGVDGWTDDSPLPDDEVYVPLYKDIELAAGHGSHSEGDHNHYMLRFSKATLRRYGAQKENVVCFPVHGDSMLPVMPDKTTVTVDTGNKKIIDGGIYAICQDGLCRLKLLYRQPGNKVSIRSYNKDEFPDEEAELSNVDIIGRVINWSVMAW